MTLDSTKQLEAMLTDCEPPINLQPALRPHLYIDYARRRMLIPHRLAG
jgi:hypothetical protein